MKTGRYFKKDLPGSVKVFCVTLIVFFYFIISPAWCGNGKVSGDACWEGQYARLGLAEHLSYKIFSKAMSGFQKWDFTKKNVLTIIDFTQPSNEKRCYVLDLDNERLLYRTYVAHGRNTGLTYAREFSNIPNSYQSSLGFFRTAETYRGKHGYSLRLDGLESQINDLARERAIVIHAADYAKKRFLQAHGRLGRSLGCPALPPAVSSNIIDRIKNGSCLFVYADDREYLTSSSVFSSSNS